MNTQPTFPRMHVSLYVSNIAETVKFYDPFFGQLAEKIKPGYAKYHLANPALIISFVENAERVQSNFGHLGFQVESGEELQRRLEAASAHGLVSLEEMGTACCYAVQDKFWAVDPDGHQWEVYHFHEDAEFNDPHYAMAKTSETVACCSSSAETKPKPKVSLKDLTAKSSNCC